MLDGVTALLLTAQRPPAEGGGSFLTPLVMMGLIFGVFYFLLVAPARKKQRLHAEMLHNLKNGDKVVTNGGIYGTVVGVAEHVVQLRIADQVKIDVAKQAIADKPSSDE
jgi:preprotein translocase subunit YajC